jgi:PKD repeat protein
MKKLNKTLVIIFIGLGMISMKTIYACSHYNGGEITYSCIGKDSFLVTFSFYRDCNSPISFINEKISAKCASSGTLLKTLTCTKPTPVDFTPSCKTSCTRCQSSSCSFTYGFEKFVYTYIFELSNAGSCCDIIFSYTACCRPCGLANYNNNSNSYYEARLNRCLSPCDNSPVFLNDPVNLLCKDHEYVYSFYAVDQDKDSNGNSLDSLSFEIVPPLNSATSQVTYNSPYTYDKPFEFWGFPNKTLNFPRGFHFDNQTGTLKFRPNKVEQTVMAMKVTSWRKINGIRTKISEITRDVHYIVISCPANYQPILPATTTLHYCAGDLITLNFTTTDYDTDDTLTISAFNLPDSAAWSDNNGTVKKPMGTFYWQTHERDLSDHPYNILIKVVDDNCPVVGQASTVYSIFVHNKPKAKIRHEIKKCNSIYFYADELSDVEELKWYINNKFVANTNPFIFVINRAVKYPVRLEIIGKGCTYYVDDTLDIPYFINVKLPDDTILCAGSSLTIKPSITDTHGNVSYIWSTGDTTDHIYIGPLFQDTMIVLEVQDSLFCHSDTMLIKVDQFDVKVSQDQITCPGVPSLLRATPIFDEGQQVKSYFWRDLSCGCPKGHDSTLSVYLPGVYTCTITNENGCTAVDTIQVHFYSKPEIIFSPIPEKCLNDMDFSLTPYSYPKGGTWNSQEYGLVSNDTFLLSKATAKEYMVLYSYTDTVTGCSNTDKTTFKVKDYPKIVVLKEISYCDEDKQIDLFYYVSPATGIWDTTHPAIVGTHYFNPHLAAGTSQPLIYTVDSTNGCENTIPITYNINPTAVVDFIADVQQGSPPLSVSFTNLSTISKGSMSYLWSFGDGGNSILTNPSHTYLNTGKYNVKLMVLSDSLCAAEKEVIHMINVYLSRTEEFSTNRISVYPNPAQDKLIIESAENLDKIVLYNFFGAKIIETTTNNESTINIEREKLPSGLYSAEGL